jgi:hypothetical protein
MQALLTICGFLGGALLTSLWYTFGMSRDIVKFKTEFEDHLKNHPVCAMHNQVQTDIKALEKN